MMKLCYFDIIQHQHSADIKLLHLNNIKMSGCLEIWQISILARMGRLFMAKSTSQILRSATEATARSQRIFVPWTGLGTRVRTYGITSDKIGPFHTDFIGAQWHELWPIHQEFAQSFYCTSCATYFGKQQKMFFPSQVRVDDALFWVASRKV